MYVAVLFFFPNRFLGGVLSSQIEESQQKKKKGVYFCRSTRRLSLANVLQKVGEHQGEPIKRGNLHLHEPPTFLLYLK